MWQPTKFGTTGWEVKQFNTRLRVFSPSQLQWVMCYDNFTSQESQLDRTDSTSNSSDYQSLLMWQTQSVNGDQRSITVLTLPFQIL